MALCPLENSVSGELAVCIFRVMQSKRRSIDLEDGDSKFFQNVTKYLPVNMVSCPRKRDFSSARDERTPSLAQYY